MSKVSTIFGGGDDAADASRDAGEIQAQATRDAAKAQAATTKEQIAFAKESRDLARGDLQPFRDAGEGGIDQLTALITDPNAQAEFVLNNPFFTALAKESERNILQNQAAKGKVGSGGTAEALQNSIVLLGSDLLNQRIGQTQNLVALGQNAAAGQGTITQNTASNVGNLAQAGIASQNDLLTSGAAAQAAGIVGAANAKTQAANAFMNLGGDIASAAIMACDINLKENIRHVGHTNSGLPLYLFNYIGDDEMRVNVMAQDVEKVMPDAVIEKDGIKYVKMGAVYGH